MSGLGKKGKHYPDTWITGPDPLRHKQYLVWLQQRNQAQFRKEGWDIDFDVWLELWGSNWSQRGRNKHSLCMTRTDKSLPWTVNNIEIVTRGEHLARQRTERK